MRQLFIFILLFIVYSSCIAQNKVEGVIYNEEGNPIEFCAVVVVGENIGTYTNQSGQFYLDLKKQEFDSLVFSHVGYRSQKVAINDLLKSKLDTIFLEKGSISLKEVEIRPRDYNMIKYKSKRKFFGMYSAISPATGYIVCYYLNKYSRGILTEVSFHFNRVKNTGTYVALQLLKKDSTPNKEKSLLDTNLVYNLKKGSKKLTINLNEYFIQIPSDGVLIGLEVLEDPGKKNKNAGSLFLRRVDNPGEYLSCISTWNSKWAWWSPKISPQLSEDYDLMIDYKVLVPK